MIWEGPWERGRREGKPLSLSFIYIYICDNLNAEGSRRMTGSALVAGRLRSAELKDRESERKEGVPVWCGGYREAP